MVNLPTARHHPTRRVSLGLSNLLGLVGGWTSASRWLPRQDADLALLGGAIRPELTILDATRPVLKNGPCGRGPADLGRLDLLAGSCDPLAVEAFGAGLLEVEPGGLGHLELADGGKIAAPCGLLALPPEEMGAAWPGGDATPREPRWKGRLRPVRYISTVLWLDRPLGVDRFWARVWRPGDLHLDFYDLSWIRRRPPGEPSVVASNAIHVDAAWD